MVGLVFIRAVRFGSLADIFKKIIRACFLLESLDRGGEVPEKSGLVLKEAPGYPLSQKHKQNDG